MEGKQMFESRHSEGSDKWYDDLEAWMRSEGKHVFDETIMLETSAMTRRTGRMIAPDLRIIALLDQWEENRKVLSAAS